MISTFFLPRFIVVSSLRLFAKYASIRLITELYVRAPLFRLALGRVRQALALAVVDLVLALVVEHGRLVEGRRRDARVLVAPLVAIAARDRVSVVQCGGALVLDGGGVDVFGEVELFVLAGELVGVEAGKRSGKCTF